MALPDWRIAMKSLGNIVIGGFACLLLGIPAAAQEKLLAYPDQWKFEIPTRTIILTSDQQLMDLQDPDKQIELTLRLEPVYGSLREICEDAKARGCHTVKLAFDDFFRQYRKESKSERNLTPDSDEFIAYVANISGFMEDYGLGLELSLLSPLEIGKVYARTENESGHWLHYTVDLCDSVTGKFSAKLWEQLAWSNNKGKVRLRREGVRVFAFRERTETMQRYRVVPPEDLVEIRSGIALEEWPGTASPPAARHQARRIRIFSEGSEELKGYNRVLVVLRYASPEMDYFSPRALPFLKNLVEKYHDAGINLDAFYSDEMHIQHSTGYNNHHDYGQFAQRYMTGNMAREYAGRFGAEYEDMEKYMLYFAYGPPHYENHIGAFLNVQYVMGESPEEIQKTALFRDRYFKLLNERVVDLFLEAKQYAEFLYGKELLTRAHATWAESPTIDFWEVDPMVNRRRYNYEYTPNFIWSNTVHQAAAACYDYFKWGEYLTAMGTDHTEGGMGDRNYYAAALASSFAMVNEYPNAYNGAWGMPAEVRERWTAIFSAYGSARAFPAISNITGRVHRDVDVLMLYPMNLVASEERFGSWTVQYGYANYLSSEKLLEMGRLGEDGKITVAGRDFSTLVALFEPLPDPDLLGMMDEMIQAGGTVLWCGPPPLIDNRGKPCLERWEDLFGVQYEPSGSGGRIAAGKQVTFLHDFRHIPEQTILTEFLVDHVYPVSPVEDTRVIARVHEDIAGTLHEAGEGKACFLGFRPRDDQSQSLGYEQRTLFEILDALGAYPTTDTFPETNDNTEHVSRSSEYLCTRFPNRTTVIARHYRTHPETWTGGFGRDPEADRQALEENPLPTGEIKLDHFRVNGHEITYQGDLLVAFRLDEQQGLLAFSGRNCDRITLDGREHVFSDRKLREIAWTPVEEKRQLPGKAFFMVYLEGEGEALIPLKTERKNLRIIAEGDIGGTWGKEIPFRYRQQRLRIPLNGDNTGRWLFVTGD
jgi:hypothetical protein